MSKAHAVHALKLLGAHPHLYDFLQRLLEKDNLTYPEIGTTKKEVDRLYMAACKTKAKAALEKLLHGFWGSGRNPPFAECHSQIWDWLHRANLVLADNEKLALADIGTTREKIEEVMEELRYLHYYNLDCNYP